jgi:error-prone DNA polymerase
MVLLGPQSHLAQLIYARRFTQADKHLRMWHEHGVKVFVEIVTHQKSPEVSLASDAFAARMLSWAIEHRTPAVLTNAVRYLRPQDSRVADVLDAARTHKRLTAMDKGQLTNQAFLASSKYMWQIAQRIASATGDSRDVAAMLWNHTVALGEQCVIDPKADLGLGNVYVPELSMLLPDEARTAQQVLQQRCQDALEQYVRHDPSSSSAAQGRMQSELGVISDMGFAGYLLTVAEVVNMVRDMNIRVAARGSGAGSFLCYLLGISGVDPIAHNLLMERFVSRLRPGLPDIDVDVESDRRLEIYDAIFAKFGNERTACVSMRETYRVRHAIRDVGAAFGYPVSEIDAFAKTMPRVSARHVRSVLAEMSSSRSNGFGALAARGDLDQFLDIVEALDGLPRHMALHPCGIVLSDATLLGRTAVQPSGQGYPMTQFDKDDVEHMGLLKLDVLGVRMQSALAYAVAQIQSGSSTGQDVDDSQPVKVEAVHSANLANSVAYVGTTSTATISAELDINAIPLDDPATFDLIASTHTLGCFQIESPGQRELVGKFAPETFNDLIVDISLFRPGPMKSDMITPFLQARQGWTSAQYVHPDLKPILAETSGVVVFHEQVIRIFALMTGCSLEHGDLLRRQLGDATQGIIIQDWFLQEALKRGYARTVIDHIWDILQAFASFGFCKAHAAAFALPTYQSAWLKAHHPAEFLAAVLTHDPGMYPKRSIVAEVRRCGIELLTLDVNKSQSTYVVEHLPHATIQTNISVSQFEALDQCRAGSSAGTSTSPKRRQGIRIALADVKGIDAREIENIVRNRPYESFKDFIDRAHISRTTTERIMWAGGFDGLHAHQVSRRELYFYLNELYDNGSSGQSLRSQLKRRLDAREQIAFDVIGGAWQPESLGLPELSPQELVNHEMEVLGMDVSAHVVSFYQPMLDDLQVTPASELLNVRTKKSIFVAGIRIATQSPPTRSGKRVIFVSLDDPSGISDLAFFDRAQQVNPQALFNSHMLLAAGVVRRTGPRGVSISATGCWDLAQLYDVWQTGGRQALRKLVEPQDESVA